MDHEVGVAAAGLDVAFIYGRLFCKIFRDLVETLVRVGLVETCVGQLLFTGRAGDDCLAK